MTGMYTFTPLLLSRMLKETVSIVAVLGLPLWTHWTIKDTRSMAVGTLKCVHGKYSVRV